MRENNMIPIFFACDDNFVKYTMVSLQSIMDNASRDYHYVIHILHTDICDRMKKAVSDMANENFEVHFDNVTEYLTSISGKLPLRDYYSKTTYFRVFIAEMFPEYEKAIYIDSDTVVPGDISQLYFHELGDNYVGACQDQVMVQEDIYGQYAEKVLGIDRHQIFNAGLLLINCHQFRENHVLEQFMELLHVYNFVVTQDEDYLNVICKDKVLWMHQQWNTLVFGKIPYDEKEFKIIHYNMVSKPWHYEDARYAEYFWHYAKETAVYEEIKQELANYTQQQKQEDEASGVRLAQTAKAEIEKENNYYNMLKSGKLKSRERLVVLEKIAELEREGRFLSLIHISEPTRH